MKDPTEVERCLIAAKNDKKNHPPSLQEVVDTGIFVRSIMKLTNLDFVYVFSSSSGVVVDTGKIKDSLQQVLGHYPTLAGRLVSQGNQVVLNNQGAALAIQRMPKGSSIQEIPQDPPTGKPYCHIPIPSEQLEGKAPILTITITQFEDGWTMGVVMLHLVADAWSFAMFLKDWSDLFNGKTDIEPVQYQLPEIMLEEHATQQEADDAALQDLNWIPMPRFKQLLMKGLFRYLLPSMMTKKDPRLGTAPQRLILHYSASQLQQLKENAATVANTWVSTNEALMAHLWKILVEAAQLTTDAQKSILGATFAINLRSKLPGISKRLVGNVVTSSRFVVDFNKKKKGDSNTGSRRSLEAQIHTQMRSALSDQKLRTAFLVSNRAWTDQGPCHLYISKTAGDLLFGGIPGVLSWNWQRSNPFFDGINFGSGPPLRGIPWSWNQPLTILPSCPSQQKNGGADVYMDTTERGPVSWKKTPSKWATIGSVCGILSLSGSVFLLKSAVASNKKSISLLWLTTFGLLSVAANSYAKRDAEQSKQDFHDYVKANAHRGLKE